MNIKAIYSVFILFINTLKNIEHRQQKVKQMPSYHLDGIANESSVKYSKANCHLCKYDKLNIDSLSFFSTFLYVAQTHTIATGIGTHLATVNKIK